MSFVVTRAFRLATLLAAFMFAGCLSGSSAIRGGYVHP